MRRILLGLTALSSLVLVGVATSPAALANTHVAAAGPGAANAQKVTHHRTKNTDPVIYDSTVEPNPGNLPSVGFEATQGYELGNLVNFATSARVLDNVVVQMSSWGCETGSGVTCATTAGATFNEPVTFNIYNVGNGTTPGTLVATDTQTFAIPYRPSADAVNCTGANAGAWYDSTTDPVTDQPIGCLNGLLTNITFNFGHVTVPNSVVYGIAYNTSDYGSPPYGDATACHASSGGCGYDSLNIGLSNEPGAPSVGTDNDNGTIYWDTTYAGFYCDGGTDGVGIFRNDSPEAGDGCWTVGATPDVAPYYIPAVQFNAVTSPAATITSANSASAVAGTPFSFTVTTTGVPTPSVTEKGKLPKGLTFLNNGNGTATISGTARVTDHNKAYHLSLKASNRAGRSKQAFTLTLTGGV